jgi:inosose dehydratase
MGTQASRRPAPPARRSRGASARRPTGYELPPGRVLAEMAGLGLKATELGPTGYPGSRPGGPRPAPLARSAAGRRFLPVAMHVGPDLTSTRRRRRCRRSLTVGPRS